MDVPLWLMYVLIQFLCLSSINKITCANPGPSSDDTFCLGRYGYYADETSCSRYVLCIQGTKMVFNCVSGSVFVSSEKRCVKNASCPIARSADGSTTTLQLCDVGYRRHRNTCFKLFPQQTTMEMAASACEAESATLAEVQSKRRLQFLMRFSRKLNGQDFWVSPSNMHPLIKGNIIPHTRRRVIDVVRSSPDQYCIKLSALHGYRLVWAVCQEQLGFFCQKPLENPTVSKSSQKPKLNRSCEQTYIDIPQTQAIIGGRNAVSRNHPWMVSLQSRHKHICGATLINRCWTLTAAHCLTLPFIQPADLPTHAVFGWNSEDTSLHHSIRLNRKVIHPEFQAHPVPTNDIALIKLAHCTVRTRPMCPTHHPLPTDNNVDCYVVGFGATDRSGRVRNQQRLQILTMPILSQSVCTSSYLYPSNSQQSYITDAMFCAGYLGGERDSCRGDSGGPLICTNHATRSTSVWGVVSWGEGCAQQHKPGVYTKVSMFHSWIQNTTGFA